MKHNKHQCLKCTVTSPAKDWDAATRKHMLEHKMNIKTFKSIRESAGQWQRNYICPSCMQASNMKNILGR